MSRTSLAALFIALAAAFHLIGQHLWLGESPTWFNTIFAIWSKLINRSLPQWGIGLILAMVALVIAWAIWKKRSRIAAILFLAAALWEGYWRLRQARFVIDEGFTFGTSMIVGCIAAAFALLAGLFAVYATLSCRRR